MRIIDNKKMLMMYVIDGAMSIIALCSLIWAFCEAGEGHIFEVTRNLSLMIWALFMSNRAYIRCMALDKTKEAGDP